MAVFKVQVVKRKTIGYLDVQLPNKGRLATVLWPTIMVIVLSLLAMSILLYFVYVIISKCQVSHGGDSPKAPRCGGMHMVPNNVSRYVEYPYPLAPNGRGNRCAFPIFSDAKEVRISFANYSFQPSSNPEFIVAELSYEGGDELKYSKLEYSRGLVAKVPLVIYYTSDGDEKESKFVIEVSPIESSGSSAGYPGSASMNFYEKTGTIRNYYPWAARHPMDYLAVFQAPTTLQPSRHFTCTPRNSTCCNATSLYQLPTAKLGGIASRLTGLSTVGVKVSSEVTVVMMFCLRSNFDASAAGSLCLLEWHDVSETTVEVDHGY